MTNIAYLIAGLKAGLYDVPPSTAALMQEAIAALEQPCSFDVGRGTPMSETSKPPDNVALVEAIQKAEGYLAQTGARWLPDNYLRTLLAAARQGERVPREPTESMQEAGRAAMFTEGGHDLKRRELFLIVRKGWRAMYDAAPTGVGHDRK